MNLKSQLKISKPLLPSNNSLSMNPPNRWPDVAIILIVALCLLGAVLIGYYVALTLKSSDIGKPGPYGNAPPPASTLSSQYGTGVTATPNNVSADNYTAPTAWTQIGIIKTEDPEDNTFYPLFERRVSPQLDIFQYVAVAIDRGNYRIPLPDQRFLETGTNIGSVRGLESKGSWVVDRYRSIQWAYT